VTLYAGDRPVAFASVWRVDWSERGAGNAIVVGNGAGVRVVGADPTLGCWLAESFNRYFEDVLAGLPWSPPRPTAASVEITQDLATGLRATGADVVVEISEPLDRRLVRVDAYDLGGIPNALSTVFMPCRHGAISIGGIPVEGTPLTPARPTGPVSTAFLADAEVWCDIPPGADQPQKL
jgi:hypothetical protein